MISMVAIRGTCVGKDNFGLGGNPGSIKTGNARKR